MDSLNTKDPQGILHWGSFVFTIPLGPTIDDPFGLHHPYDSRLSILASLLSTRNSEA